DSVLLAWTRELARRSRSMRQLYADAARVEEVTRNGMLAQIDVPARRRMEAARLRLIPAERIATAMRLIRSDEGRWAHEIDVEQLVPVPSRSLRALDALLASAPDCGPAALGWTLAAIGHVELVDEARRCRPPYAVRDVTPDGEVRMAYAIPV